MCIRDSCNATGAPAGPLNNIADIFGDRQFHARRNLVSVDVEDLGETVIVPNVIPRLSETPGRIRHLGPKLGEHTDLVLTDLLGMSADEIGAVSYTHLDVYKRQQQGYIVEKENRKEWKGLVFINYRMSKVL